MTSARILTDFFQRNRNTLVIAGILLLILGMRIFVGVRCLVEMPQLDDSRTILWLQKWSQGIHDWTFIFERHNDHPMELFYLATLGEYLLNGYWDGRLDFLIFAFIHTIYAAVAILTFGNILALRDRWWIYLSIFMLFAVPFAGYRIAWGFLWPDSILMVFSLSGLYLVAHRGQSWGAVILICLLAAFASVNVAAGCLGPLMICGLTLFQAALARRITSRDLTVSIVCLAIFLSFYLTMGKSPRAGFMEGIDALFKALAWPAVFIPAAGLFAVIPMVCLVIAQILFPSFRQQNVAFVTSVAGLIFLVAIATGLFRGENNNMGMPSGRYTDLFIILPLVSAVTLCLLYRGSSGRYRMAWGLFACIWLCFQFLGFSIQIIYRVVPFVAQESGEWNEAHKQVWFREVLRGKAPVPSFNFPYDETLDLSKELLDLVKAPDPKPAITVPMIVGFNLQPGSQGNYAINGYHPSYQPRPARLYWGSFNIENREATDKWFISGTFQPRADYITLDVLVDKKARFTNYRLEGLQLTLVDKTSGQREELLPRLAHTYPFVFRDWELIYARVTPGHEYQIESHDSNPVQWLAFSEPFESGKLTPFLIGVSQSGKFFCLCGIGLLTLVLCLDWFQDWSEPERKKISK